MDRIGLAALAERLCKTSCPPRVDDTDLPPGGAHVALVPHPGCNFHWPPNRPVRARLDGASRRSGPCVQKDGSETWLGGCAQRRTATQESAVAAGRSPGTGVVGPSALGQSATPGSARLTRPTDAEDPGTNSCFGGGSREASGDTAADDPPRSRTTDGIGVRVGDWNARMFRLRQADRQLRRSGSIRSVQR